MNMYPSMLSCNLVSNPSQQQRHRSLPHEAPRTTGLFELFGNNFPPLDAFEPTPIRENAERSTAIILDTTRLENVIGDTFGGLKNPPHSLPGEVVDSSENLFNFFDDRETNAFQPMNAPTDLSSIFGPAIDAALVTTDAKTKIDEGDSFWPTNVRKASSCIADTATNAPKPKKRRISADGQPSFRHCQETQWMEQFEELVKFKNQHGNCLVPHHHPENQILSRWVKRQRYQYKLKMTGKTSTMTNDRIKKLEDIGFVWNSHTSTWDKRYNEMKEYVEEHGNCDIPMNYPENPDLATWVKCQRRQYKLFWNESKSSSMTLDRMQALDKLGFIWNVREQEAEQEALMIG